MQIYFYVTFDYLTNVRENISILYISQDSYQKKSVGCNLFE